MNKEENNNTIIPDIKELTVEEPLSKKEPKRDTNMRNANIRVSLQNTAHEDNDALGIKIGDTFEITEEMILDTLSNWLKTKSFNYYLAKHDEDTSNSHCHLVLDFGDGMCKFSTIKNKFPYGNIESCKSAKASVQYLVHMNHPAKHQYSWNIVKTNAPAKLENYKIPGKRTIDAKLQHILDLIIAGELKECDIPNMVEPDIYIRYASRIKNAFEFRRRLILNDSKREIQVVVLVGPTGVGKSTFVREYANKHGKSVYFSGSGSDFVGDYHDEDILCLDDYNYENFCIEDCLKLLDPFTNTTIKSRFHNRLFIGDTIFLLTNYDITTFYNKSEDALRLAFYRRITNVFVFGEVSDDHVVNYTINDIVPTDDWFICENNKTEYKYRKMKLVPKTDKEFSFDLKKYISFDDRRKKNEDFINQLTDL